MSLIRLCRGVLLAAAVLASALGCQRRQDEPPPGVPGAFADNPIGYFVITERFHNTDATRRAGPLPPWCGPAPTELTRLTSTRRNPRSSAWPHP
jgi:hypothetical protein